ncbi:hypothetical protein CRG98_029117 [Punica granatum]|uniref:Uncharacterized protein n=1 Tax=Punica granatum TaxID=22663 RepID=A0A2I0J2P9_PUNGR|nr:hypothetical protein CRG98_029117 [Punica granatum]
MTLCYPSTPKKLAMTVGFFFAGAGLFGYGLHLWYVNAAPQRARIQARSEFVKEKLRRKYGDGRSHPNSPHWQPTFTVILLPKAQIEAPELQNQPLSLEIKAQRLR